MGKICVACRPVVIHIIHIHDSITRSLGSQSKGLISAVLILPCQLNLPLFLQLKSPAYTTSAPRGNVLLSYRGLTGRRH